MYTNAGTDLVVLNYPITAQGFPSAVTKVTLPATVTWMNPGAGVSTAIQLERMTEFHQMFNFFFAGALSVGALSENAQPPGSKGYFFSECTLTLKLSA